MMHRLGIVPQRLLCEPFRVANCFGAFCQSVAVTVERDALDAKPLAALAKSLGAFFTDPNRSLCTAIRQNHRAPRGF